MKAFRLQPNFSSMVLFMTVLMMSCGHSDVAEDKKEVMSILKNETEAFAEGNYEKWADYWKQSPDILFTYTMNNQSNTVVGFETLGGLINGVMASREKNESSNFSRDYHDLQVNGDMAWAHFTQTDTLDGIPTKKHESRTLQRINGHWKIIGSNIVNQTSFGQDQFLLKAKEIEGVTHISINDFPKDMIVNHVNGWGGMAVAVNEPPSGTDFSPLLEGLTNNSCQVPHWGYLEKGTIRMKYDDGKEETLNSGEVFYMPPGHTAVVEKNAKLIEFSPQAEFKEVVEHIEKKVAAMQNQ